MCEWQRVSLFLEGPGPCRCPASSSYTVYTKLCMYKIEKSAKKTRKEMCYSQTVLFYWETTFRSFASWILSLLSTRRKEMWGHYYYLESGLCAQLTAHCTIANTGCPHGACKDTQLAQWQRSFAENLGQGGRSTQCPLTNSTDPASVKQHKHCATSTHILPLKRQDVLRWISQILSNHCHIFNVCIKKDKFL